MEKTNVADPESVQGEVRISYFANGKVVNKLYELLVVACDPRNLSRVCNYDPQEMQIFNLLQNFTFHTTLMTVPVTKPQQHGVIFAPYPLDKMQGSVYAFRNESAKKFGLKFSNTMQENLVTVYQLVGPQSNPYTPAQFAEILARELPTLDWWPFGNQYTIKDTVTTPYFDHFSQLDLKAGMPWRLLNLQGNRSTLYVHASTCFESVLDCWGYENMLLGNSAIAGKTLPASKSAPIAIIGAGVSGLLFAIKLKRLGYTNIDILESTDRYGGKTHTIKMDGPYPPGNFEPTYCELGTCYMSPAYAPMLKDLQEYLQGNTQISFGDGDGFRAIATQGQLPPNFNAPPVMNNRDYVLRKAEAELGYTPGEHSDDWIKFKIAEALGWYLAIHLEIFGDTSSPMPFTPPQSFLDLHSSRTFIEFLRYHKLQALVGILQYGYEVQGYGTLDTIPAFYGLIWISPPIIEAMLEDALNYNIPIVTAWSKGWGDVWDQVVVKEQLKITYNVTINAIIRKAVGDES